MPRCSGRQQFTFRTIDDLEQFAVDLEAFGERHAFAPDTTFAVNLALEEVVTNTLSYGFEGPAEPAVDVELCVADGSVIITVTDGGRAFDPLAVPEPDVTAPIEARPIGGLGTLLVRKLMDETTYARAGGRNVLTLKKAIAPSGRTAPSEDI